MMKIGLKGPKVGWPYRIMFAVFNGVLFALMLWVVDSISGEPLYTAKSLIFQGAFFAVFFGLLFPLFYPAFGKLLARKNGKPSLPRLLEQEQIEADGPANLFSGITSVGGQLFLTDTRIIFLPHRFNLQRGQTEIAFREIKEITTAKTAGIVDNGLRLTTHSGTDYKFAVNEREVWTGEIQRRCAGNEPKPI